MRVFELRVESFHGVKRDALKTMLSAYKHILKTQIFFGLLLPISPLMYEVFFKP